METSRAHQKQKLTLLKLRRLAHHTSRPSAFIAQKMRANIAITALSVVVGIGLPALIVAAQQAQADKSAKTSQTQTTEITVDSSTSPSKAEVFLTPNETTLDIETLDEPVVPPATNVTINGQPAPLVDGSVSKHYVSENGSTVDINVTIDSSTTNLDSSTSTDISIDSNSFSSEGSQQSTRGSPRR